MKNRENHSKRHGNLEFTTAPYSTVMRMYSDFREQAADVYGQMDGTALNVAVAYEDFSAGVHAMRTFGGLFGDAERQLKFDMRNAWKFDFLRIAELREAAIAETVRADLIIVSMHAARELPATVKWWIETALAQREGDPGALVLLHDGHRLNGAKHPPAAEAYLTQCAQKAGLDFFVKRAGGENESKQPTPEPNRNELVTVQGRSWNQPSQPMCSKRRFSLAFWE
jgi:hypothetical protein